MKLLDRLRTRNDAGFTLVELMIASLMGSILIGAALSVLDVSTKAEKGQAARQEALIQIRGAMDRFTKDVRQATSIDPTSTHDLMKMTTLINGTDTSVAYTLVSTGGGFYELRRQVGTAVAQTLVTHMVINTTSNPDPAFCYAYYSAGAPSECIDVQNASGGWVPSALTAVRLTLAKAPESNPSEPVTLATDVQLRNL